MARRPGIIKTAVGFAKSKVRKVKADTALRRNLLKKIGSPNILGRESYDFYGRTLKKLIKAGKQEEAVAFAVKEAKRVNISK